MNVRRHIVTLTAGDDTVSLTGFVVGEDNGRARDGSSRRVSDGSYNGGLLAERAESAGKEKQKKNRAIKSGTV